MAEKPPLISIIIPLYNLERLIGKCIQSTLDQNLQPEEYEVLVVDDGSTDGSLAAAQATAQGHPNVRVFTKSNEGVSLARNYGTDRATGRYVMYMDADDTLVPNVLAQIATAMERDNLDMLCFDLVGVDEQDHTLPLWCDGIVVSNGFAIQCGKDLLRRNSFVPVVWGAAYDREFLNRHALRMVPIGHEDEEFIPRVLYFAQRLRCLPLRAYNYLQRSTSFMHDYQVENYLEQVKGMKSLADFADGIASTDPEGAQLIRWRLNGILYYACKRSILTRAGNTRQIIAACRQAGLLPLLLRRPNIRHKLLNYCPSLFILYYRLHKAKK